MLKELKLLDKQLKNNQLIRIQDSTNKIENSLFRALSMAIFYSHQYFKDVKLELQLTLISNLQERRFSSYPPLFQTTILKKYESDSELILHYWEHQQLQCFQNDNLLLASAAFSLPICILTIDKEQYLNQTYLMGCKNPRESMLYLAKAGKKFYCVFEQQFNEHIKYVRDSIVEEIVSSIFEDGQKFKKQEIVHYSSKDEVVPFRQPRQHKKSLSDCNEVPARVFSEQIKPNLEEGEWNSKQNIVTYHSNELMIGNEEADFCLEKTNKSENEYNQFQSYDQQALSESYQYYGYQYPYMMQTDQRYLAQEQYLPNEQNYGYAEPTGPINNERYTGRLKFFDQNGNYGFLVIDNLNSDLFVHYDDLSKAGLSKQKLLALKNNCELRFQFTYYEYEGKQHKKSKKAVDLQLLSSSE